MSNSASRNGGATLFFTTFTLVRLRITHVALDLRARHEGRDRVDHQHVERAGAYERVGDLECLLAVVGLRDEQILGLDAELAGVVDVERVLRVDEGGDAAPPLALG